MTGAGSSGDVPADGPADVPAYAELIDALRDLQDAVAGGAPQLEPALSVTATVRHAASELRSAATDSAGRRFGRLDVVGRGQTMCPPLLISQLDVENLRATLRFGPFHGGFGDHAHGGAVALVLNEAMGTLANASPGTVRVAAFVRVDYRSAATLGATLDLRAEVAELKGRKQTITATLVGGGQTVAEAEGLFLSLAPAVAVAGA